MPGLTKLFAGPIEKQDLDRAWADYEAALAADPDLCDGEEAERWMSNPANATELEELATKFQINRVAGDPDDLSDIPF